MWSGSDASLPTPDEIGEGHEADGIDQHNRGSPPALRPVYYGRWATCEVDQRGDLPHPFDGAADENQSACLWVEFAPGCPDHAFTLAPNIPSHKQSDELSERKTDVGHIRVGK